MTKVAIIALGLGWMAFCGWAAYWALSAVTRVLRQNGSASRISPEYFMRKDFSAGAFAVPAEEDWQGVVRRIENDERSTIDGLLPGGPLRSDLVANAVNVRRYSSDAFQNFAILRIKHPDRTDEEICFAMRSAAQLLQVAAKIPFGRAVTTDRRIAAQLSFTSDHRHCADGFAPAPSLRAELSNKAPGHSDLAY